MEICYLIRNESGWLGVARAVEICFADPLLCKVFNTFAELEARYGASLARTISLRMSVLKAVGGLGEVPPDPPVCLTALGRGEFSVRLQPARRLRFRASQLNSEGELELAAITQIEVLGVEG